MYEFRDINETSEGDILPSEALQINGDFIEVLIPGYRTLNVSGREALSPELDYFETGSRDGVTLKSKRYPARTIIVKYQLIAESNEAFREAYNQLAAILNVEEAELIFNDEPDKFFTGTPSAIGEVPPGRNAVVGEFELFCADPFKYSVVEYEAKPEPAYGSFLIDYRGTYKAYPTLEAEFYEEDESKNALVGHGDCGYVAFFNENRKIIQLGDPDETNTESYAKSQTLVNQKFNNETAWGTIAETNWATNVGKVSDGIAEQAGNVAIAVASHQITKAPETSGTLLTKTSKVVKPYVDYKVTAKATGRSENSVNVEVTITTALTEKINSGAVSIKAGAKVKLSNTKLYISSTATEKSNTISGTYYLWDASVIKDRIRITNASSRVGKSGQVTGWVNVSDLGLAAKTSSPLGKGIGLRGAIQFNNGDWHYATIKSESSTWKDNNSHTSKVTVKVNDLEADTTLLENIRFKVEHTDSGSNNIGEIAETSCKSLEISAYTAPVPNTWYLMPQTFGTNSAWHGPSITRTIPADDAGDVGAKNFTFSYCQKLSIGSSSSATQEIGAFQVLLISGSGESRRIIAGVSVYKSANGKNANLKFYVGGKTVATKNIDLSFNNKYFGNNSDSKGIKTVKTSIIKKSGKTVQFNIGGIKKTFKDSNIANLKVNQITFLFAAYGAKPTLAHNGLYWAKFIKDNCDTWENIPNKFSSNDIVTADCRSGEVFLNDAPSPSLGALGNDWEDFYLTPGLNQIGFSYSSWVKDKYAPDFKIRYREVFI